MIEYRDVHKAFDAPVLRGISLTVATGEILSIVGPSGTGKSVLLKTTNGLIVPDRGQVLVDGAPVFTGDAAHLEAIRRKVGYVFQNAALFDSMNVFENVAEGLPERAMRELGAREVLRRVVGALEDVRLEPAILGKSPAELSGGMRKRVGLARAIIGGATVMLYDEPVTGLDPVTSATVAKLMTAIARRPGVTTVVVTHDVDGALEMSDRVALLAGGTLRFVGTPEAFRASRDPLVRAFADRRAASALDPEVLS
jgi:phospholipid/cholesterol/gamma-HCH transport system ATP-binding protein